MRTCTVTECGRRHQSRGYCDLHYRRLMRTGDPLGLRRVADPVARFHESYAVDETTGCWLWTSYRAKNGYAQISVAGRLTLAHRFSYELHVGPIADGLQLDHVYERGCRHKHCVRPDHLEPVTHQENALRAKALVTACPQGHPYDEINTSRRPNGWRTCKECNRQRARRVRERRAA